MPDKIVRDELLRSHRYVSLKENDAAKVLFVHLLLSSDNLCNAEATETAINLAMGREIDVETQSVLLQELGTRDLVRPYQYEGKLYVHIPRQRQRMRYLKGKHPRPPESIEDKAIRDLLTKDGPASDRGQTVTARSEVVEKRSEEKGSEGTTGAKPVDNLDGRSAYAKHWYSKGAELGMEGRPGENDESYIKRVRERVAGAKRP